METRVRDFVFEPDYQLESFSKHLDDIIKNKHLPYIPSATEIETSGANLGEVTMGLVRNTEEMYLYMKEMNSRIDTLEKEKAEWEKEKEELIKRIEALENRK